MHASATNSVQKIGICHQHRRFMPIPTIPAADCFADADCRIDTPRTQNVYRLPASASFTLSRRRQHCHTAGYAEAVYFSIISTCILRPMLHAFLPFHTAIRYHQASSSAGWHTFRATPPRLQPRHIDCMADADSFRRTADDISRAFQPAGRAGEEAGR